MGTRAVNVANAAKDKDLPPVATDRMPPPSRLRWLPILLLVAGLIAAYAAGLQKYIGLNALIENRTALQDLVTTHPANAVALYMLTYFIAASLGFPGVSVLTILGGLLFGWFFGGLLAVVSASLGASVLFLAARTAFGDLLKRRTASFLGRFSEGFRKNAFGYLLVLRLAPIFPFFVVNIAPAFFNVTFKTFLAATCLGMLPAAFAYAWLGSRFDASIALAERRGTSLTLQDFVTPEITLAFAVLACFAALPLIARHWLAPSTESGAKDE